MERVEDEHKVHLLKIMARRLDRQSRGSVALDDDPLLQHAVVGSVLGSPYLSPTGLREIALRLKDK